MASIRNWTGERVQARQAALPREDADVRALTASGATFSNAGARRSYSDVCLPGTGLPIDHVERAGLVSADWRTGRICVEAGVRLTDLCRLTSEHGWMPFVLPGTGEATVGGCVANDVHGKNHPSAGAFGDHVEAIRLSRSTSDRDFVVRRGDPLFGATIGGLGLTGAILDVSLRLVAVESAYLNVQMVPMGSASEYVALEAQAPQGPFRAAWVDLTDPRLGGYYMSAAWAEDGDYSAPRSRAVAVPFSPPFNLVSRPATAAFSWFYRTQFKRARAQRLHYSQALWPLDAIRNWNRLYGPRGFLQYQVVTPTLDAVLRICAIAGRSGLATPLTVLKTFGDRPAAGWLSFARRGYTLAVDFRPSKALPSVLEAMDEVVRDAGGAWYPAKYRALKREDFLQAFPRWPELLAARDPAATSAFYERMR